MSQTIDRQLIETAKAGNIKAVERALLAGAGVHANNGVALRLASNNGHTDVVDMLLKAGADVHAYNDVALRWAAENGHTAVANILIQHGADLTALHQAKLNQKQRTGLLKQYAATACRGVEAVMMLEYEPCLDVLCHLHPELKPKQIREELAMLHALGLDTVQMAEMWQARHGVADQPNSIEVEP